MKQRKYKSAMRGAEMLALRKEAGLTQPDAAARLGVSVTTLSRWEREAQLVPQTAALLARIVLHKYYDPDLI